MSASRLGNLLTHGRRLLFGQGGPELAVLLLLLLGTAAGWVFLEIADEVVEGETHAWDEYLILAMRSPGDTSDPAGPGWFEEVMRDITAFGGVAAITGLTLLVAGFLFLDRRRKVALVVLVSVASGVIASMLLKQGFDRPRPDLVSHGSYVVTSSFPSGHSMVSAVAYLTLGALLARALSRRGLRAYVLGAAVVLTVLIGVSRVYLGVHWPSDVLAGWSAGAFWACLCGYVAWRTRLLGPGDRHPDVTGTRDPDATTKGGTVAHGR